MKDRYRLIILILALFISQCNSEINIYKKICSSSYEVRIDGISVDPYFVKIEGNECFHKAKNLFTCEAKFPKNILKVEINDMFGVNVFTDEIYWKYDIEDFSQENSISRIITNDDLSCLENIKGITLLENNMIIIDNNQITDYSLYSLLQTIIINSQNYSSNILQKLHKTNKLVNNFRSLIAINSISITSYTTSTSSNFGVNIYFNPSLSSSSQDTRINVVVLRLVNKTSHTYTLNIISNDYDNPLQTAYTPIPQAGLYEIIARTISTLFANTVTLPLKLTISSISPTWDANSYVDNKIRVTFLGSFLNIDNYNTVSKVSLFIGSTEYTTSIVQVDGPSVWVHRPGGFAVADTYTLKAYDSNNASIHIATASSTYEIYSALAITTVSSTEFTYGDDVAFTLTFNRNFVNSHPKLRIEKIKLNSSYYPSVTCVKGAVGTNTIAVTCPNVNNSDKWTVTAYDGLEYPINASQLVNYQNFISNFIPTYFQINNSNEVVLEFADVIGTSADPCNITEVRVTRELDSKQTTSLFQVMDSYRIRVYFSDILQGTYYFEAKNKYNQYLGIIDSSRVVLINSINTYTQSRMEYNFDLTMVITFYNQISGNDAIKRIFLRNIDSSNDYQMTINDRGTTTVTAFLEKGVKQAGQFDLVAVDNLDRLIYSPRKVYFIALTDCIGFDGKSVNLINGDKYKFESKCVDACPAGYLPDKNRLCLTQDEYNKIQTPATVTRACPEGSVLENRQCVACSTKGLFEYNEECVQVCPTGYGYNTNGRCIICKTQAKLLYEGKCLITCPYLTILNIDICQICGIFQVWYDYRCYDKCPTGTVQSENKVCVKVDPNSLTLGIYKMTCSTNPCKSGTCVENIQYVTCNCNPGFFGQYCDIDESGVNKQLSNRVDTLNKMLDDTKNLKRVSVDDYLKMIDLTQLFEQNPSFFKSRTEIKPIILIVAATQFDIFNNGGYAIDPNFGILADISLSFLANEYRLANTDYTNTLTTINTMKDKIEKYADVLTVNKVESVNAGGRNFLIQTGSNLKDMNNEAKKYQGSIINNTDSLLLKLGTNFKISKIDFKPSLINLDKSSNITSNQIKYRILLTNSKLRYIQSSAALNEINVEFSIPVTNFENFDKYNTYKLIGIDMFDSLSAPFYDRCFSFIDATTQWDTTINFRREKYFDSIASCGVGCKYEGVTVDKYIKCTCLASGSSVEPTFKQFKFNKETGFNTEIVNCSNYTSKDIVTNKGLYIVIAILGIYIVLLIFTIILNCFLSESNITSIIKSDARFWNDTRTAKEYFNPELVVNKEKTALDSSPGKHIKQKKRRAVSNVGMTRKLILRENKQQVQQQPSNELAEEEKYESLSEVNRNDNSDSISNKSDRSDVVRDVQINPLVISKEQNHPEDVEEIASNEAKTKRIITYADLNRLPLIDIKYDKRSFCQFYSDHLLQFHNFIGLFRKSLLSPHHIRVATFILYLSSIFFFNAIFYTDDYIDTKAHADKSTRDSFVYPLTNEFIKLIISYFTANGLIFCVKLITQQSISVKETFGNNIDKHTDDGVRKAYYKVSMLCQILSFYTVWIPLNVFFWYYIITFASIYRTTSLGWIYSSVITILGDLLIVELIVIPIIISLFFSLSKYNSFMG